MVNYEKAQKTALSLLILDKTKDFRNPYLYHRLVGEVKKHIMNFSRSLITSALHWKIDALYKPETINFLAYSFTLFPKVKAKLMLTSYIFYSLCIFSGQFMKWIVIHRKHACGSLIPTNGRLKRAYVQWNIPTGKLLNWSFISFKGSVQWKTRGVWSSFNSRYLYVDVVMGILLSFVEAAILYGA
jgi:hypothetical protein